MEVVLDQQIFLELDDGAYVIPVNLRLGSCKQTLVPRCIANESSLWQQAGGCESFTSHLVNSIACGTQQEKQFAKRRTKRGQEPFWKTESLVTA